MLKVGGLVFYWNARGKTIYGLHAENNFKTETRKGVDSVEFCYFGTTESILRK